MIVIFAETHKIIASALHGEMQEKYDIELNEESLQWGSVVPDLFPKYKLQRHYIDDSLHFIANEITTLIFVNRFMNLNDKKNSITKKLFSRKLGIISHYLSDFCCLAHANNWSFNGSFVKHVQYEKNVNEEAKRHTFEPVTIQTDEIDLYGEPILKLRTLVSDQIVAIVEEYKAVEPSYACDLNFALALNTRVASFIIEVLLALQGESMPVLPTLVY